MSVSTLNNLKKRKMLDEKYGNLMDETEIENYKQNLERLDTGQSDF